MSLTFGGDHSLTIVSSGADSVSSIPGGPSVRYETLDEVYPMQLYMVLEMEDRRRREPLGIYKIERGRLVICPTKVFQRTYSVFPIGEPRHEWPTEFRGNCYALDGS